ncbi:MAG: MBL fold metallo-hydrolase [Actinomycetota bacterium]
MRDATSDIRQLDLRPDDEPVASWEVGDVRVTRVVEGISEFPRGFLPDLTDERIAACGEWVGPYVRDDLRRLLLSTHSFVLETPESIVVVDTCVGAHIVRPMRSDPTFGDRLADAIPGGPEAVDVVICTHLHFDHVGWNTWWNGDRWVPTFPLARHLVSVEEYEATVADDHMEVVEPSVAPLREAGLLDVVPSDHRVDGCLRLQPSPGHSPGHVCVEIESDGRRALITGDATHSPLQFVYPDVSAVHADDDSTLATLTRERLVADLADTEIVVLGTHFPTPTAGLVRRSTNGLVRFDAV